MEIYVIRHGETEGNRKQQLNGWSDDPLNQDGMELAEETGRALKGVRFDAAFTSPLSRAVMTAKLVLRESGNDDTPLITDDRIKEVYAGDWEGVSIADFVNDGRFEIVRQYLSGPHPEWSFPNGETLLTVQQRTQAFLREVAQGPYQRILVSTHGGALRCMLNFLYPDPNDLWQGHLPYNCAVSIVRAENGHMTLEVSDRIYYDPARCIDRYALNKPNR